MRNSKKLAVWPVVSQKQTFLTSKFSSEIVPPPNSSLFFINFTWYLTTALGYFLISGKTDMNNLSFLIIFSLVLELSSASFQCWTCQSKCGCRSDPMPESCPAGTKCYTLKSLANGDGEFFFQGKNHCEIFSCKERLCIGLP